MPIWVIGMIIYGGSSRFLLCLGSGQITDGLGKGHKKSHLPFLCLMTKRRRENYGPLFLLPPRVTDLTFVLLSHRLEDEWLPLGAVPRARSVKICHLPEAAKVKLHADLFGRRDDHPTSEGEERETPSNSPSPSVSGEGPPRGASRRKQKWPPPPPPRPVALKGTEEDGAAAII